MTDFLIEWVVANKMIVWLLVALLCLLFEMGSPGLFFFLSFFFGALIAAASTFFVGTWLIQSIVFIFGTSVSFFLLHYWVKKDSKIFNIHTHTNVYAMRSKMAVVLKTITAEEMGKVKIGGEVWSARSAQGETIKQGSTVIVLRIKGAHVIVEKAK